jgi:hypothetical protein
MMKRQVGLWIDHYKTVMVTLANEKEETREIRSNVEKNFKVLSSAASGEPVLSPVPAAEEVKQRTYMVHLNEYFDGVISLLRNADSIFIFGPGEAKLQLKKRLENSELSGRINRVDTVDKMTNHQISMKVRQHYKAWQQ